MDERDQASIVRAIFLEGWNRQEFGAVSEALAEFRFHIGGTTRTMHIDELREIVRGWHIGFPDLEFELHNIAASEDIVAAHVTLCGTHRGTWQDLAPTGRPIEVEHMFFFRFDQSQIVDVWELLDRSLLSAQLTGG